MKARNDFITNSSSSSFIVGFTSEDSIEEELKRNFPEEESERFDIVLKDIIDADKISKEEVLDLIREEIYYTAKHKVMEDYRYYQHIKNNECSYSDAFDYIETKEGKKEIENRINQILNKVEQDMGLKSVFVEISYSDNDGSFFSSLEHEIMPELESTVMCISHH